MDIPSANKFSYRKYTVAEMTKAFEEIYKKAPKTNPLTIYGSADAIEVMNYAVWDIILKDLEPCPNCGSSTINKHCSNCDYPYNEK